MSWDEALALAQALGSMGLPDDPHADIAATVTEVALEPNGTLRVVPGSTPAVSATGLATLLRHALPEPGKGQGPAPPGALRYTVSRALREVEAPPIVTVRQLAETLARFERTDRATALAALHSRLPAGAGSVAPLPVEPAEAPQPVADLPLFPEALEASAPPAPEVLFGDDREITTVPPVRIGRPRRSAGLRLVQTLAALVVIGAGGLVGYLAYEEWPRLEDTAQSMAEAARDRWEQLRTIRNAKAVPGQPDSGQAPQSGSAPTPSSGTGQLPQRGSEQPSGQVPGSGQEAIPPAGTAGQDRQATGDRTDPAAKTAGRLESRAPGANEKMPPEPAAGSAGTAGEAAPPTVPAGSETSATSAGGEVEVDHEGRVVQALDAGRRPIFSPSFAFDGSAVFFHQDTAGGGSAGLREARGDPSGEMLHVVSLLDDGWRNYHPRLSPDGTLVAFDSDRDGLRGVYVSARDGTNVRRVSGPGYAAVPSWSPDGSRLAFIRAEPTSAGVWNIWVLNVRSGDMTRLTSHSFGQPWGASWFPDGRRVCYSHEDRLIVLDTTSGSSSMYPSPRKGRLVRTPAVSPDGRKVIFQLYRDGAWLLDLPRGSMRRVLADPTAEEFSWAPDGRRVAFHSRRDGQWGVWVMAQE